MAPKSKRCIVFHLSGDRTEAVPVDPSSSLPIIGREDFFVYIEAADGSEVGFRAEDIITMHLKDAA